MTRHAPTDPSELKARLEGLRYLLEPGAVAIVGASADPTRIGGKPVRYYRENGFRSRLYPINPNRDSVQGYRAYRSLDALPEPIDFVLIAVPAAQVEGALRDAIRAGAKAALVFSAGFAETGADGAALQARLVAVARAAGVRLLGPNCLGLFNARVGHFPTFSSFPEDGPVAAGSAGRVGLITQSGAYGTHVLKRAAMRRIGVNIWVSTGNEADVAVGDVIEYLAHDPGTDVIACYLEGVRDRHGFLRGLAAAHEHGKPVVLIKVGRSAVGAGAAASHTASLAGSDAVFDAALRPYAVERADTTEELLDVAYALGKAPLPRGRRLGILTISGGAGVLMADAAERAGLDVPPMPEDAQLRLQALIPFGSPRNPVDVTAQAVNDFGLVTEHLRSMLDEGRYDCAALFFTTWAASGTIGARLEEALRQGRGDGVPMALVILAPPEIQARYEELGFLVFEDPSRAVAALGAMARLAEALKRPAPAPEPARAAELPVLPSKALSEAAAKRILAAAGLPVLPERLVTSAAEAQEAAMTFGGPVALKLASPDITHKTEVGGVLLGVAPAEAAAAYERILDSVRRKAPEARIEGVLAAPMAREGVELIIGARDDPVFGPVTMVGMGGIFVEVLRDVVLRVGAVTPDEARRMLAELKGATLLEGARGRPPADMDAAAEAISRLSALAVANEGRFESIEVNPLLVRPRGQGAAALDALIVAKTADRAHRAAPNAED